LEKKGDNDGALALFSKSQAIRDELCTKEPENLAHRRDLGIACFWVGKMLANLSRWQESAEAFEQAIKATKAVIDAGGSFGSLNGDLDVMTNRLNQVRGQLNKKWLAHLLGKLNWRWWLISLLSHSQYSSLSMIVVVCLQPSSPFASVMM
jgi:hypothetical protein